MRHSEGTFESQYGEDIYYQTWLPEGVARAAILLVHGLAEHSSRYEGFAEYFTTAGFAVHTLDQPGHGKSGGLRCHIRRFGDFHDAVEQRLTMLKEEHPELPVFLVGHSLGGLIAVSFLISHQQEFAGAILSGAAIRAPQEPSGLALMINRLIAAVAPKLGVLQLDAKGVSRDPAVVERYESDPLVFRGKVTAKLAAEVFGAMDAARRDAASITLPLLVLHGDSDVMTDVAGSKEVHANARSANKRLIVYEDLYHEIFNEPERLSVLRDVRDWIETLLAGRQGGDTPPAS